MLPQLPWDKTYLVATWLEVCFICDQRSHHYLTTDFGYQTLVYGMSDFPTAELQSPELFALQASFYVYSLPQSTCTSSCDELMIDIAK